MIDILNFIDDLKEIKTSLGPITDNKTMKLIDDKIGKCLTFYQKYSRIDYKH